MIAKAFTKASGQNVAVGRENNEVQCSVKQNSCEEKAEASLRLRTSFAFY